MPHISDLLLLWHGVTFETSNCSKRLIRAALLCVACDLPAGRKVCGFLSYTANLDCSRCYCSFGTSRFGHNDYSGLEQHQWIFRTKFVKHRKDVDTVKGCLTKTEKDHSTDADILPYSN